MNSDAVQANYSDIGARLIEMMYSDDYLSIGGTASTDRLAELAGVSQESRVLDVGSGLGGPAIRLAEKFRCRVTGIDLVESNVRTAGERAADRDLGGLVEFRRGDAMALPFDDGAFDVVWGQDAWCHVPDKAKLIAECARVTAAGGRIAFTDWIEVGAMEDDYREEVLSASASANLASRELYCELLQAQGFEVTCNDDISADFIAQYRAIMKRLDSMEAQISGAFSPRVYAIVQEKNGCILRAFEDGKLGGGRFVAVRP